MNVEYKCKVCKKSKSVVVDDSDMDCEIAQSMFDVNFPALTCNRCADWRASGAKCRDQAETAGRRLLTACQMRPSKDTDEVKRRIESRLDEICSRFVRVNTAFLGLSARSHAHLKNAIINQPECAADIIRKSARSMIDEAQNKQMELTR